MRRRHNSFLVFLCCVLAVPTCASLMGELILPDDILSDAALTILKPWLAVGTLLGIAHVVLRPILRLISAPIGCITLGLSGFVIDVLLIYGCAELVEGFAISGPLYAILTALTINVICAVAAR